MRPLTTLPPTNSPIANNISPPPTLPLAMARGRLCSIAPSASASARPSYLGLAVLIGRLYLCHKCIDTNANSRPGHNLLLGSRTALAWLIFLPRVCFATMIVGSERQCSGQKWERGRRGREGRREGERYRGRAESHIHYCRGDFRQSV